MQGVLAFAAMGTVTDIDQLKARHAAEAEELRHERDTLTIAIAEHVEALGGEGNDGDALRDSLGQIERLLAGKDIDAGLNLQGVAGQVEALVWLNQFAGTDNEKTEAMQARLDLYAMPDDSVEELTRLAKDMTEAIAEMAASTEDVPATFLLPGVAKAEAEDIAAVLDEAHPGGFKHEVQAVGTYDEDDNDGQ